MKVDAFYHMLSPCIKIDKLLVVCMLITLCNMCNDGHNNVVFIWQIVELCMQKARFQSNLSGIW